MQRRLWPCACVCETSTRSPPLPLESSGLQSRILLLAGLVIADERVGVFLPVQVPGLVLDASVNRLVRPDLGAKALRRLFSLGMCQYEAVISGTLNFLLAHVRR